MQISYWEVYDKPGDEEKTTCAKYGHVCTVMANSASHSNMPISYLNTIIAPAIHQENIKFYFNEDGSVVGYVVWARLCASVERTVIKTGEFVLHPSEWNEGESLWIVDFLVPYGSLKYVLEDLRDNVFSGDETVRYMRVKNNRRTIKEIERNPALSFFSRRNVAQVKKEVTQ